MANIIRSFRSRMLLLMVLSMSLSGIITFSIFKILQNYYHTSVRTGDFLAQVRNFIGNIGDLYFFMMIFVPLAILFFFLFTKRYSVYFTKISEGIHQLAKGDFHNRVQISSHDEFENIANDINLASEQLQQAIERGEFAETSKDQLVVNLAHDLRTPLTSVLGYLDIILKNGENLTKEQKQHYTTIAYTKSQRLEQLIEDLFKITKMNYGKLQLERKTLDLTELFLQLNEELYPIFEKNNLISRLTMPCTLLFEGDGNLLARVFENLLSNAIRYGNEGQYVDINGFIEEEEIVIQVINYGGYIAPEVLPHIFDMFYKGDQSRTYQEGSTGLGLYIAKEIVEQHGGSISCDSTIIRTLFEVRLPNNLRKT